MFCNFFQFFGRKSFNQHGGGKGEDSRAFRAVSAALGRPYILFSKLQHRTHSNGDLHNHRWRSLYRMMQLISRDRFGLLHATLKKLFRKLLCLFHYTEYCVNQSLPAIVLNLISGECSRSRQKCSATTGPWFTLNRRKQKIAEILTFRLSTVYVSYCHSRYAHCRNLKFEIFSGKSRLK
mgnify:CR=1 FL=1